MKRGFTIHHNGPPAQCIGRDHSRCIAFWNAVRDFHVNAKGWSDIAYSFGTCPHGVRFMGRGWDRNQFANGADIVGINDGPDSEWYSVLVFVGGDHSTGDTEAPTSEMVRATAELITEGRSSGRCGMRVLPHNAWKPKPCPGPQFTALANAWDNQPITIDQEEDDMTPEEADAVLVHAIKTPGHKFRTELAVIIDSRLVLNQIARRGDVDIDEAEVTRQLLTTLTPGAIAAAIPAELAKDVADELAARLAP